MSISHSFTWKWCSVKEKLSVQRAVSASAQVLCLETLLLWDRGRLISSNRMLRRHVLRVEILCFMQDTLWWLFSCSVVSDSLWPHGLQHTRLPCPSLSPGVCSNSCPLSWWCYLTTSSFASLFSFLQHLSQHQGLFQRVWSPHQEAKILELQLQLQSFQWVFTLDFL